jgi:serine/threonine protein kinase/Flp pilus assembly protein TadD
MAAATLECLKCGTVSIPGAKYCSQCATPLTTAFTPAFDPGETKVMRAAANSGTFPLRATQDEQATVAAESTWASPKLSFKVLPVQSLGPGATVGGRYEILRILGEGGMGAVYEARDREVDRIVAFKVIRADLIGNSEILNMFKQELVLARQVTHRNVVRIYDLGTADGLRFITMQFVEGQDLKYLIRKKGKLPPAEAAAIMLQVLEGLEAAHKENVVHRDLKPQNIMVDAQGGAYVMDFGLAHSTKSGGTEGILLGTPDYMSPEQARREDVDARSDLFTCGLIFYEMLTGELPFSGRTLTETLEARVLRTAVPPAEKNPGTPKVLSNITARLMATAREDRYQTAAEVIYDLQVYLGIIVPSTVKFWKRASLAAAAAILALTGVTLTVLRRQPQQEMKPVTTLIADFRNNTGDPVFTGTLESTLKLALEGASFISAYDRTRMKDLGLKVLSGPLDEAKAQQIAASQGLNVVISGSLDRQGSQYRLSLRAIQPITGKVIKESNRTASDKAQVLSAVTSLGTTVRVALGDSTSESAQRLSMETLNSVSLEAVHAYAEGLNSLSAGQFAETQQHLSKAISLDPNFGMAWTVMASAARNLGHQQEAANYIHEAIKHIGNMTERERYRTRGYLYYLKGDHHKCADEYGALLQKYPADTGAYTNLGVCRLRLYDVANALEAARKAAAILPKRAIYRANLAMALAYSGDARGTATEAAEALKLGYNNAFLHQAYAALLDEQPEQAAGAYARFQEVNPSDAATGLADLAIYQGRLADAAALLEKGVAADSKSNPDGAATKLWMLATVQLQRGQNPAALASARRSLELSKTFETRFVAARVDVAAGDIASARHLSAGLASEFQVEAQAFARVIEGEIALKNGHGRDAVRILTDANKLLDTWIGRFDLGRAYLEVGGFAEADSEFDRCIKRRGEALAMFLDLPTYGFFPSVYYYQGRAREGMKVGGYVDCYRKYLDIRGRSSDDRLVADVKTRVRKA